jgi:hypothetical protein
MLLGLARRIGLLYGLLELPVGLCASSNGEDGAGSAWAGLLSTPLNANAVMPSVNRFIGSLST